jgi:hypothetical protein
MKIDDVLGSQTVQESKKSEESQSTGAGDSFALLLQGEITGQAQQVSTEATVNGPADFPPVWGVQSPVSNLSQQPGLSQAVSTLDGVLAQFDSLKDALQGVKSPKEINAMIEQISAQTAGLDDKMSGLPADHQLRDLSEELKVSAYMESVKWNRGDYL